MFLGRRESVSEKEAVMAVMANLLVVVLVGVAIWKLGLLVVSMGLLLFLSFPPFKRPR
jgi:hypothetical protein